MEFFKAVLGAYHVLPQVSPEIDFGLIDEPKAAQPG